MLESIFKSHRNSSFKPSSVTTVFFTDVCSAVVAGKEVFLILVVFNLKILSHSL